MIEALNKIAELAAEVGKAQLILEDKDNTMKQMDEHIGKQNEQMESMNKQMNELNRMNQNLQQRLAELEGATMAKAIDA